MQVDSDVNVDNVSFHEFPGVWDAMAYAFIHRGAHALGEFACTSIAVSGRICSEGQTGRHASFQNVKWLQEMEAAL